MNMNKDGFDQFLEVGPKNVLNNFNKKLIPELNFSAAENIKEYIDINE